METRQKRHLVEWRLNAAMALVGTILFAFGGELARAEVRTAVKRALPATVGVKGGEDAAGMMMGSGMGRKGQAGGAYGMMMGRPGISLASGTIVSADGLIVTMAGCRDDGKYTVTLADGRELEGNLLVDDRRVGLKLLKVEANELPFLSLSTEPAQIGEEVIATYCLDMKERAAARGIVAATNRKFKGIGSSLLQLDVEVGNLSAGAPVVDEQGKLLGIIVRRSEGASSISFAVPVGVVQELLSARQEKGPTVVERGLLGLYLTPGEKDEGRVIARLAEDSPAAAAGVRNGDEILAIDGKKIESLDDLGRRLGLHTAGEKVSLSIRRDGTESIVEVTLVSPSGKRKTDVSQGGESSAPPAAEVRKVTPEGIWVFDPEGRLRLLSGQETGLTAEKLRELHEKARRMQPAAVAPDVVATSVPTIHVERSNLEQKLDEIAREMKSLREKMDKLTDELQQLKKPLPVEPPKR